MNTCIKNIFFYLFLALSFNIYGQHDRCGTSIDDQQKMEKLHGDHANINWTVRTDKIYIPIRFQLIGNNDGSGRVVYSAILKNLARLNRDYAKWDIVFYLKDSINIKLLNHTPSFSNPRSSEAYLSTFKDLNALNIFVCDNIGDSGVGNGIVLGYYSPDYDFVVARAQELIDSSSTLSHEIGHFFSLRHTFYGWEEFPYNEATHGNPYTKSTAPGTSILTEWVDRSNCNIAADQICDTPPDFNFGITQNTCNFGKIVLDKNLDTIKPMANNQMSYFSNCQFYLFTENQITKIKNNYAGGSRSFLRKGFVPKTDTLPTISIPISPAQNEKVETFSNVIFTWENQGAQFYLLEIFNNQQEYYAFFTKDTTKLVTSLKANKLYFYTVRPFNEGYTDVDSPFKIFRTGSTIVGTEDTEIFQDLTISPNPVLIGQALSINIEVEKSEQITISLVDNIGRNLIRVSQEINAGPNSINLPINNITPGIYYIRVAGKKGAYTKKIIVQ